MIGNNSLSIDSRDILASLLLQRFRACGAPIVAGLLAFSVLHIWAEEPNIPILLAMKLIPVAALLIGIWISERTRSRSTVVACLLTFVASLFFITAMTNVIIGHPLAAILTYVTITLAAASFLPWGVLPQAITIGLATLLSAYAAAGSEAGGVDLWYSLLGGTAAFAGSIYIAREIEKYCLEELRTQQVIGALADSRADIEGLFQSSNVLLSLIELTDDDVRYVEANTPLASLFGTTPERIRGKLGRQLGLSEKTIEEWRAILLRCQDEGSLLVPEYLLTGIDPPRWFQTNVGAIRDESGVTQRFSAAAVEITALRQANENVRLLNATLEDQVRDRTALLEAANKDLESFAYSVSHDLRTPLRSIEGFASLLHEESASELSESALGHLDRIHAASRHMARLIDDILMLSRATRSEIHRELIDVTKLVEDLAAVLRSHHSSHEVRLEVQGELTARADPHLLRIVLINLLENSWKYTADTKDAQIQVGSELQDGEKVFFVRENGCGFDMQFAHKLFKPFERLHTASEIDGTGIGLATVARIVRRHGGKTWAEGKPGQGATFRFTLHRASSE